MGAAGTAGATGATGAVGAVGAVGPTGINVTATTAFATNSAAVIAVIVGGTAVPLPSNQIIPAGITVDGTNTIFTVVTPGFYRISYHVNTTAALLMATRILINGIANVASTVAPLISLSSFSNEILLNVAANTTVTLQLFGLAGAATLLTGAGASLMIERLS